MRGYTVIELLVGLPLLATAVVAIGLAWVAIHFIAKVW